MKQQSFSENRELEYQLEDAALVLCVISKTIHDVVENALKMGDATPKPLSRRYQLLALVQFLRKQVQAHISISAHELHPIHRSQIRANPIRNIQQYSALRHPSDSLD